MWVGILQNKYGEIEQVFGFPDKSAAVKWIDHDYSDETVPGVISIYEVKTYEQEVQTA